MQLGGQIQRIAAGDAPVDYIVHFVLRGRFPSHLPTAQNHYGTAPPPFLDEGLLARARHRAAEVPVRYLEGPIQVRPAHATNAHLNTNKHRRVQATATLTHSLLPDSASLTSAHAGCAREGGERVATR